MSPCARLFYREKIHLNKNFKIQNKQFQNVLGLTPPFPVDLPDLGMEPESPVLQADSLPSEPPSKEAPRVNRWRMEYLVEMNRLKCLLTASSLRKLKNAHAVWMLLSIVNLFLWLKRNVARKTRCSALSWTKHVGVRLSFDDPFNLEFSLDMTH